MVRFVDYYGLLGIPQNASTVEIQTAFREREKQLRPDTSLDETMKAEFQKAKEARDTLVNPFRRTVYDLDYALHVSRKD